MKKVNIDSEITLKNFGNQWQLKLLLDQKVAVQLCMALVLLRERLTNVLGLKFSNFLMVLKPSQDRYSYSNSESPQNGTFNGEISTDSIDYILHYVLKYYRDGFAEAEHIDIEFSGSNGREFTLTINCSSHTEYSADDIKKMLG